VTVDVKTSASSQPVGLWTRALVYMLLFGIGWFVVLPAGLLRIEGDGYALRTAPWIVAGVILSVAGCAVSIWAGFYLITRGGGTPFPLDPTRQLVASGPYRYVRNPQAVGTMLIVLGEVAVVRSTLLLLLIPLSIAYLEGLAAPFENRELRLRYGARYLEYRARVPKWVPRRISAES
jgi:protein-S-isoprenylcysteine O-methyltransferase Ste14